MPPRACELRCKKNQRTPSFLKKTSVLIVIFLSGPWLQAYLLYPLVVEMIQNYFLLFLDCLRATKKGRSFFNNVLRRLYPASLCSVSGRQFLDMLDHLVHHLLRGAVKHARIIGVEERVFDA